MTDTAATSPATQPATPGKDSGVELTSPESSPEIAQTKIMSSEDLTMESNAEMIADGMIMSENEPEIRTDVVRESDKMDEQELPEEGEEKHPIRSDTFY